MFDFAKTVWIKTLRLYQNVEHRFNIPQLLRHSSRVLKLLGFPPLPKYQNH